MVDRFDYVGGSYPMAIKPNGEFVEYDDYATLEARIAELEKDAARYRWLLNCGTPNLWRKCGDMDSYDNVEKEIDEAMSREA